MQRLIDNRILLPLAVLSSVVMMVALWMVFFYAPVEQTMGIVQKIFYVHVPAAMAMYAGFLTCAVCSFLFLLRPSKRWDQAAVTGAELGLLACVFVLISGPLWAYKAWGVAWTWDPQLTATFVLFLMYGSYVLLRTFGGTGRAVQKVSAVLALLAVVNVPIVHYAVTLWGGMHPVVEREGGGGLADEIALVLQVNLLAFLMVFGVLLWMRFRTRMLEAQVDELYLELEDLARLGEE